MKLIFITREGYDLPGARIRCYNFARELSNYNIDTEVLSFSDTLGAKDGEEESQMGITDKIKYNWKIFRKLIKEKETVFYIQRFNYHSFAPYFAHLFNKNRIILDLDDWEMREFPRYYLGFYPTSKAHYFTAHIAKRSIFCIAASRFLEKFLRQFNKMTYYIPSGVDSDLFKPTLNNLNKNEITFSWIGTLHKKEYIENIKFALDCFILLRKKYSHIYFDIVGDGIYSSLLRNILQGFDDSNIRFKIWIPPDKMPEYLNDIQIGLFPVVSDNKFNQSKSPTKLFEYMSMAKPTVSSSIGDSVHIIQDGNNGFLANCKEEFVKKMQELIMDSGLRQQLGASARETVENNYSLKILGKRLYGILKEVYD